MLTVLSLFSGIGGIDYGLESTGGFQTVAFCEIDPFCREVLRKHWPGVPIHEDVCSLTASTVGRVDAIVGGFPCQPHSVAGKRKGREDERHLWPEFARLVREIRPRWVLAENVPGIRSTAADEVLADLEEAGYTCWPFVVGADDVGAPHRRKRVWFVARVRLADSDSIRERDTDEPRRIERQGWARTADAGGCGSTVAHRDTRGQPTERLSGLLDGERAASRDDADRRGVWPVGSPTGSGLEGLDGSTRKAQEPRSGLPDAWPARPGEQQHGWEEPRLAHAEPERRDGGSPDGRGDEHHGPAAERDEGERHAARGDGEGARPRRPEQPLGTPAYGLPLDVVRRARRLNREALKAAGNSVVPQVVAAIGRAILAAEGVTA